MTVNLVRREVPDRGDHLFAVLSRSDGAARRRCRDEIVLLFLPTAHRIAHRYAHRGIPVDDLRQICALGLVKAVDRFDPSYGGAFLGFARPTITGEVKRHFRDHGWALTVSRRYKDLAQDVSRAQSTLTHELGRSPSVDEMAVRLDMTGRDVRAILDARRAYTVTSMEALAERHGVPPVRDPIGYTDPTFDAVENCQTLRPALATLTARERQILAWRFYVGLTQDEVAARLGISQMHVSRLQARALAQLRLALQPAAPELALPAAG